MIRSNMRRTGSRTRCMRTPDPVRSMAIRTAADQAQMRRLREARQGNDAADRTGAASTDTAGGEAPSIVHDVLGSSGHSLDPATRAFFEPRFGFDFSQVRVHSSSDAASSAQAVNAHAYTVGSHIVFGSGRFAPGTQDGRRLLAHELTHVVQQGGAAPGSRRLSGSLVQAAPATATRSSGGAALLQRFLSTEPAGGCGLCYGTPANVGKSAHALVQLEFEVLYPVGLVELGVSSPSDENGRLDLALAAPGGFEIGEIKPANEQGYADGILQIGKYIGLIQERYPGAAVKPLTKLLPPAIFPTLSPACPVQVLFVISSRGWCVPDITASRALHNYCREAVRARRPIGGRRNRKKTPRRKTRKNRHLRHHKACRLDSPRNL